MKMMEEYAAWGHTCSRPAYAALYLAGAFLALPEGLSSRVYRAIHPVMHWVYDRLEGLCGGAMVDGYDRMANHFAARARAAHVVAEAA